MTNAEVTWHLLGTSDAPSRDSAVFRVVSVRGVRVSEHYFEVLLFRARFLSSFGRLTFALSGPLYLQRLLIAGSLHLSIPGSNVWADQ